MSNIRQISPELTKVAKDELNEVPERIDEDIIALRTWLEKQNHLKSRKDDQFLVTFLRGTKYSLERAKEKLDLYHTIRTAVPEITKNRSLSDPIILEILKLGSFVPLPLTDKPDSPVLIMIRPGVYDPKKYSIQDIMKVNSMIGDIMMRDNDQLGIAGQTVILDLANTQMAHFLQFNLTFVKKMTMLGQEGTPLRQKGLHYVNTPSGFELVFNMFKGFMSEKNQSRLRVHGDNMDSFFECIPKRLLPAEYGGDAGPVQNIVDEWVKKVIENKAFFEDEENLGSDEKKRVGRPKNAESLFGVDGSFRKLNVD